MSTSMDIQNGARTYVLTDNDQFLAQTEIGMDSIHHQVQALRQSIADNPRQFQWIDSLEKYITLRIQNAQMLINLDKSGSHDSAARWVELGQDILVTNQISTFAKNIEQEEMSILVQRKEFFSSYLSRLNNWLYGLLIFVMGLSLIFYNRVLRGVKFHKQSEDKFKSLVEAAPDALIISGEDGVIRMVNWRAEEIFGYRREEMLGKRIEMLLPPTMQRAHEQLREKHMRQHNLRIKEGGRELPGMRKDGSIVMTDISLAPIKTDGETLMAASIRDITGRLEERMQLDSLSRQVNQAKEAIYTMAPDFSITSWNYGAQRLFGYTAKEVIGRKATELVSYEAESGWLEYVSKQLAENGGWTGEVYKLNKNGSKVPVLTSVTSIISESGILTGFISVSHDISLQKSLEYQLKQSNESLEEKVRIRTDEIRRSEQKYRYLFHHNPIPMWVIEVGTFKFLDVNEMAIQKYGYSREEFLSMTAEDIRPVNTRDSFRRENNPNIKQLNDGYRGVWQHQKKDGSLIWVEIIAHHIQFEGKKSRLILANDITEKKEAQDLLRSNEKRYRETLDNMLEGIQILDFEWRYLYVNNAVVKQARRKREDLIGFSIFDIYPNIEDTELHAVFQRCFEDRTPQHLENKFVYPDGTISWFELSFQPIPEGVFVLSVDITERVNAIDALKEERDKLASIALTSPGLIYSFRLERDSKMSFVYGSNAFTEIFGYSPEVINARFDDFLKESCPEDRLELMSSIIHSAKNLEPYQKEFRYHHPVKGLRWLKAHSLPIRENTQSVIWHGIIMDNTESKNQEEKILEQGAQLQTLSNNLPGVMIFQIIGSPEGTREFTMVSKEVTRLSGRTPEEVIKDPSILYNMILEEDRPAFIQRELESYENITPFKIEVRARSQSHGIRWLHIVSTPRIINDGRIVWDGFHLDITDRKEAEERIKNINAELEEKVRIRTRQLQKMNEELESFAYSVSHDLRAPLRGINGFADILQEDYASQLDEEAKRITRIIKENTVRMGSLIDDLLSFSRLGRHELEKVRFDTREMILQLIASMEQKAEGNRVSYDIQDLHSSFGDTTSLRQVWVNLIGNAIKYSRGNPQPTIHIGSYKENGEIVFYVKDNGVGFDMKYANKLFKVFQRLHSTDEFEGTGVGLAIVEKIINKHGGRVWASSKENDGASFYFTLPDTEDNQLENITPPKSNRV